MVAKKPYQMQTLRLALRLEQPTSIEVLICIYNLTNNETLSCGIHSTDYDYVQLVTLNYIRLVIGIGFRNYIHIGYRNIG